MVLRAGDITWFDPNWYQTHQLENHTADFCCTIQGFQYGEEDSIHWPYMQYKARTPRSRLLRVPHGQQEVSEICGRWWCCSLSTSCLTHCLCCVSAVPVV